MCWNISRGAGRAGRTASTTRCARRPGNRRSRTTAKSKTSEMKSPGDRPGLFVVRWERGSAQDAADDAADEAAHGGRIRTAAAAAVLARSGCRLATATAAAAVGTTARRRLVLVIAAGGRCRLGRDDLRQQRLVLQLVEIAAL